MRGTERKLGGTADRPEHRDIRIGLHRAHELRLMARAADLVQDDSGDPHPRVEIAVALKQRRDPAGDAPRVHDENDRRREQLRERGVAVGAVDRHAVVQPLVPLDEGKARAFAAPHELRPDLGPPHRVEVEIAAVPARRRGQPHRIDVVRALLERLHHEPARAQCGRDPHRDRGLPGRLVGSRHEQARHPTHLGRVRFEELTAMSGTRSPVRSCHCRSHLLPAAASRR